MSNYALTNAQQRLRIQQGKRREGLLKIASQREYLLTRKKQKQQLIKSIRKHGRIDGKLILG